MFNKIRRNDYIRMAVLVTATVIGAALGTYFLDFSDPITCQEDEVISFGECLNVQELVLDEVFNHTEAYPELQALNRVPPTPTPTTTPVPPPHSTLPHPQLAQQLVIVDSPIAQRVTYRAWSIIFAAFPASDHYWAARTSWCESEWTDAALGDAGEIGWWQIHPVHFDSPWLTEIVQSFFLYEEVTHELVKHALELPNINAKIAATLLRSEGPGPWTTRLGCKGWQG